jgi:hypothetical protein
MTKFDTKHIVYLSTDYSINLIRGDLIYVKDDKM